MARPRPRSELRQEVRDRLGESGTGYYTDAQLNQWLNDGVDYVAMAVEPLVSTGTVDITAVTGSAPYTGQGEYLLPDGLISIKQAYYKDSAGKWDILEETTFEDLFEQNPDWESSAGDPPSRWYWRQDVIGLYQKPDTARTGALRLLFTCRPSEMTGDTATTGLPSWLDRAVVLYVLYRCRLKDRDEVRAAGAMVELTGAIRQASSKVNKPRKDHAPRIVPSQRAYRQYYGHPRMRYLSVSES